MKKTVPAGPRPRLRQLPQKTACTLAALTGGVCWGFSGTCGQYLFSVYGADPGWLTCMRMGCAGAVLLALCLSNRGQRARLCALVRCRRDLAVCAAFALAGICVSQYCYLSAIRYSNSGTATVLQYLGPVLIMLAVCARERRSPTPVEFLALACALGGTFLLATHGRPGTLAISGRALFWGLASALGLMFYTMLPESILPRYGALTVTGLAMLIGAVPMVALLRPWRTAVPLPASGLLALLGIVLVGTVLAYTLFVYGVQGIGPARASLISCVEPVSATVFSAVWLGTAFHAVDLAGFALILATVFLLTDWKALRARRQPSDGGK